MKKLLCILSVILIAALISPTAALAAEQEDDVFALATTASGNEVVLDGGPDADEIADLAGYELIIDDESVLTVEQSDTPSLTADTQTGGYFSAEFALPDTSRTAFLTGLSADKIEEIQNKIIRGYASGADFDIIDLSFIDAEKTNGSADDSLMCWAGTSANILTYTGWAAQANRGFDTCDDLFDTYVDAFTDNGGNVFYGIGWFFNGVNTLPTLIGNAASAQAGSGGYLNDYAFDRICHKRDMLGNAISGMKEICLRLREGCGVALSYTVYFRGQYSGGHSGTCWGYIVDTDYPETDARRYTDLFIGDSDNSKRYAERRDAPNILQSVALSTGEDANGSLTFELDLDTNNHAELDDFTYVLPYSDTLEKETDPTATRDKVNTPDLALSDLYLGADMDSSHPYDVTETTIENNTAFYYTPFFENLSDRSYSGSTRFQFVFTDDADGSEVYERHFNSSFSIAGAHGLTFGRGLTIPNGLPEGDYTVTATVNGNHAAAEAYYYNNSYSIKFKVRGSYILGDADDSGDIGIMDATAIQRYLAGYGNADAKTVRRCSVTGRSMNVMDATAIQRMLAGYDDDYAIGEKQLYD